MICICILKIFKLRKKEREIATEREEKPEKGTQREREKEIK